MVLLLLAMLTALTVMNWRLQRSLQAERNERARARANAEALQGLFHDLRIASETLAEVVPPGSKSSDEFYLQVLRAYGKVFEKTPSLAQDPELRHGLAQAHYHYARAIRNHATAAHDGAFLDHFDRCIALLGPLVKEHPNLVWPRYDLFRALADRAAAEDLLARPTRSDVSLQGQYKALQVIEALQLDFPDDPAWRNAVASQHLNVGQRLLDDRRTEDAEPHFLQAQQIAQQLVAADPHKPNYLDTSIRALDQLARLASNTGHPEKGEALVRQALEASARLLPLVPENYEIQLGQACRAMNLAAILQVLGRPGESVVLLEGTTADLERLARRFPEHDNFQVRVAESLASLADAEFLIGRIAESKTHYHEAVTKLEKMLHARPNDRGIRNLLGTILVNCRVASLRDLARALTVLGPVADSDNNPYYVALAHLHLRDFREAITAARPHAQGVPGVAPSDGFCFILALAHAGLHEPGEAARWYREGMRLQKLAGRHQKADPLRDEAAAAVGERTGGRSLP